MEVQQGTYHVLLVILSTYSVLISFFMMFNHYKRKSLFKGNFTAQSKEQKRVEEKIQFMAYHDALTGLPNRNLFTDRFQSIIEEQHNRKAAILFLGLDRFELINDTLGHDVGDLLLKEVSIRLKDFISAEDFLARLGGDEFILFLPDIEKEGSSKTAQQILDSFNQPFLLNEMELYITPSMGISQYPKDGSDIGTLIKKADLALHQTKRMGKNNYHFYDNLSMEPTKETFELEKDLRKALEREEFVLHYQPKLNSFSGEIVGIEALIRWLHPDRGLIPPGHFISLAEETGMIISIGEWALRKACTDMKALLETDFPPTVVSVNLSLRQVFQPNLINMISQILKDTGLSPENLELEITESMMIDTHHALMIVRQLKKLGVKISLDDFGTGYSSLHYLKKYPIDKIKIDQSFIRDSLTDPNHATIVKTIIAMAHELKMEVLAEGVETKDQLIFLQENLCDEVQGYLFSKPLPIEEMKEKFAEIEQIASWYRVPQDKRNKRWMEEALRVAQEELQDTIRQQQGMTFKFIEQQGKFIHTLCDGELLYRMGFIPEQIIGKELHEFFPGDTSEGKLKFYRRAWMGEQNVAFEAEHNGIYYLVSLRPIQRGGEVVEVIGSCVDITERKKAEELMWESEKLSVIGQLAAGVAHEIRNPLTSINGFIELLQKEVDKPVYFDVLFAELNKLENIVREFLKLAEPQSLQMKDIDLKNVLEQMVLLFNTQAVLKDIEIRLEYWVDLPTVFCDENQIKQVFSHILQNAVEAMPNGGVIKVQIIWHDSGYIKFRFIDYGKGISKEQMKRIGEPFYTKEKGSGLGLMICQKIIQDHGGEFHIKSVINKGTVVDVILPFKQSLSAESIVTKAELPMKKLS